MLGERKALEMKRKVALLILFFWISGIACADSLMPLSTFIAEADPNAARVSYLMARCSALYMSFQILTEDTKPELGKKYEAAGQTALAIFVETSEKASKERNPNYTTPIDLAANVALTVQNLSNIYKPLMEQSYATTNSYQSNPLIKGDLEVCQILVRGI